MKRKPQQNGKAIHCIVVLFFLLNISCSVLDIDPKQISGSEKTFDDIQYYQQALNKIYRDLTSSTNNMQSTDFAGDDFATVITGFLPSNFYIYNWDYVSQPQPSIWNSQYHLISLCNIILSNVDVVNPKTNEENVQKEFIIAQAKALRAWSHFNITMLYAKRYNGQNGADLGIPLKLKLDREDLPRSNLEETYNQIFKDVNEALSTFESTPFEVKSTEQYFVFDLDATKALKARIALFIGDYDMALKESGHFVNTPLLSAENYWMIWEDDLDDGNKEFIFLTDNLEGTSDASLIDYHQVYISNKVTLFNTFLSSFDDNDVRLSQINNRVPKKYIIEVNERHPSEVRSLYYKHFRLAEQYLIYIESNLENDPDEASRVFKILQRARGLTPKNSTPTLEDVLAERRKELFTEGLRFYDLKRLASQLNITITRPNGATLSPNELGYIWQIPKEEINANPFIN